jgi:phosphohistidine phosphatase
VILYFLRHGEAGAHAGGPDDDARGLTPAGSAALRGAATAWRRLNLRPDVVISSPLARARQTAQLLVAGLGLSAPPIVDERLRPGARWPDLARSMAGHPSARRVLFVGHEPDLSEAIRALTGAGAIRLRKGGLACVEFPGVPEPGTGELAWLLDPDLYDTGLLGE